MLRTGLDGRRLKGSLANHFVHGRIQSADSDLSSYSITCVNCSERKMYVLILQSSQHKSKSTQEQDTKLHTNININTEAGTGRYILVLRAQYTCN